MKTFVIRMNFQEWYINHILDGLRKSISNRNNLAYEIGDAVLVEIVKYVEEHPEEFSKNKMLVEISSYDM